MGLELAKLGLVGDVATQAFPGKPFCIEVVEIGIRRFVSPIRRI
jgi:hypothetical protein